MCVGAALSRFPTLWATSTPTAIASSNPMAVVEASRSSPVTRTYRPVAGAVTAPDRPGLSDELTYEESQADSYLSWRLAIEEMRRR